MQREESARGQADRADPPTARHTQCNNCAKMFQKILASNLACSIVFSQQKNRGSRITRSKVTRQLHGNRGAV
eukprot:8762027-Pyramimonas_sp.AAC.1